VVQLKEEIAAKQANIRAQIHPMMPQHIVEMLNGRIDALQLEYDNEAGLYAQTGDVLFQQYVEQEKQAVANEIEAIIEADRSPLTMPNNELTNDELAEIAFQTGVILDQKSELRPDDQFTVPRRMGRTLGSESYVPEDMMLLNKIGYTDGEKVFTRQQLKDAGVFFINRVGDGEQPIFGVPIPDESVEGGLLNVQDRCFLTKEEFEKVYAYQQAQDGGLNGADARDVQLDMIMFAGRSTGRKDGTRVGGSFGDGRTNKYNQVRSPFVDSGFKVLGGASATVKNGVEQKRMNAVTIHLANAHPDYPGVSEMYAESAAYDQRYLSVGEFVTQYYLPPTDPDTALIVLQNPYMTTARERAWVGKRPDSD
jgi:hypothetical protein